MLILPLELLEGSFAPNNRKNLGHISSQVLFAYSSRKHVETDFQNLSQVRESAGLFCYHMAADSVTS